MGTLVIDVGLNSYAPQGLRYRSPQFNLFYILGFIYLYTSWRPEATHPGTDASIIHFITTMGSLMIIRDVWIVRMAPT